MVTLIDTPWGYAALGTISHLYLVYVHQEVSICRLDKIAPDQFTGHGDVDLPGGALPLAARRHEGNAGRAGRTDSGPLHPRVLPLSAARLPRRTADSSPVMYGLLGDVNFEVADQMRAAYTPRLAAEICAWCHQDANDPDGDHSGDERADESQDRSGFNGYAQAHSHHPEHQEESHERLDREELKTGV